MMLRKSRKPTSWAAGVIFCSLLLATSWQHWSHKEDAAEQPPSAAGGLDAVRAFADLKHLVDFGPRPAGSVNLQLSRQWIVDELHEAGATVEEDSFVAATPLGPVTMTNIVAKIPGASPSIVILGGRSDTKRMAAPFVGANDGGSSAAFSLEMTRVLARRSHKLTYWLVFFDGEEAVRHRSATDSLYGSRHLVQRLVADGTQSRIKAVIVVDMIADSHLDIHRESHEHPG